jgi:hypothetical protein
VMPKRIEGTISRTLNSRTPWASSAAFCDPSGFDEESARSLARKGRGERDEDHSPPPK